MRGLLLLVFILPLTFLVFGYTLTDAPTIIEPEIIVPEVVEDAPPVVIQIEHQEFPFDVDGNFPFVVMVDNVVWQFDKNDVREFISKGRGRDRGEGRSRTRLVVDSP